MLEEPEPAMYRVIVSLFWGFLITAFLTIAVFIFNAPAILLWQAILLANSVPLHNIGTEENPIYEGTPVNILAALAGILLGIPIYAVIIYVVWFAVKGFPKRQRD